MKREKVITDQQKVTELSSILDEVFSNFHPLKLPGSHSEAFFECILGYKHLGRLKEQYEEIKKEE